GDLLPECLEPIRRQIGEHDSLVVVDDASSDDTAATAERLGARVLRRRVAGGPYTARNDGWRACAQPYVLFTDARCVVRPGWLSRFRRAAAEGGDLIFSDVLVRGGDRLAERVAEQRQHLLTRHYAASPYFLPYFPTANLALRRAALEQVDGFRIMPSGGDADLCWRVQLAGFDQVCAIDEPLMEWRPRTTVPALLEQWAKYGRSGARLRVAYADRGAPVKPGLSPLHAVARHARRIGRRLRHDGGSPSITFVDGLVDLTEELAYGHTVRRLRRERSGER
ncbi:MAG TPA: glycosyltransferase, partial [Solirubrobacteraceae bacterium]|nr:glycosyltransferase [Solirubrobacteraceae bacterium]